MGNAQSEFVLVRCLCKRGLLTATATELFSTNYRTRIYGQIVRCPACGSGDITAALESSAREQAAAGGEQRFSVKRPQGSERARAEQSNSDSQGHSPHCS